MSKKDDKPRAIDGLDAIAEQVAATMYKGVRLSAEPPWSVENAMLSFVLMKRASNLVRSACFELLEGHAAPKENDARLYVILSAAAASLRDRIKRDQRDSNGQGHREGRTDNDNQGH